MDAIDLIDILGEVLPRRARRGVSVVVVMICILAPGALATGVTWYATQRSEDIVRIFEESGLIPVPGNERSRPFNSTPAAGAGEVVARQPDTRQSRVGAALNVRSQTQT
jgi:hypothetical protein